MPDEHAERVLDAAAWTIGFSLPGTPVMDTDPREAVRRLEDGWTRYLEALGQRGDRDRRRGGRPLGLRTRCST